MMKKFKIRSVAKAMERRRQNSKLLKTFSFLLVLLTFNFALLTLHSPVNAQSPVCTSAGTPIIKDGLTSAPSLRNSVVTSGACQIDPKAQFAQEIIPTYQSLKSLHFDQANRSGVTRANSLTGTRDQTSVSTTDCSNYNESLYHIKYSSPDNPGNLDITGPIDGIKTKAIFVDGDLNIGPITGNKLIYPTTGETSSGLVFIVGGKVNIHKDITEVNALIISQGAICTASLDDKSCPVGITAPKLTVNGSLISLSRDDPAIKFRRDLLDNRQPAEKINHQVKYLVILRNLLSKNAQTWSEIDASTPVPSPGQPPPAPATPPAGGGPGTGTGTIAYCYTYPFASPEQCHTSSYTVGGAGSCGTITCPPNAPNETCPVNTCHGDIYGYGGTCTPNSVRICESNILDYTPSPLGETAVCGADHINACDKSGGYEMDSSVNPPRRKFYTGQVEHPTGTYSTNSCLIDTCGFPYSPDGNHNSVCGATFTGTIDGVSGSWDDGSRPSKACANTTTRNTYYTGSSCDQTGTCNWPKPIDCAALDALSCHADVSGYNGLNTGSGSGCNPTAKTCLSNISSYVPSQGQSNVCGGTDNTTACNTNGTLKTYYTGSFTDTSCNTASCGYPYSPNGNQSTACATACLNSTTPNKYYSGTSCSQTNCPFPQATTCPTNTCHGDITGYNGQNCNPNTNLCSSSRPACCSTASSYNSTFSQANVCGNTNSVIDNHTACAGLTPEMSGAGLSTVASTGGSRRQYYSDSSCTKSTCPYPHSPAPGQQSSICGDRTPTGLAAPFDYNDSTGCIGTAPNPYATAPDYSRNKYYPGNSCSQVYCYPHPQSPIPSGCHGAGSGGWSGLNCYATAAWGSTVSSYQQTQAAACGTNHYDQACVNGSFPANVSWNAAAGRREYYDGTINATTTLCLKVNCPFPWSDVTGGEHDTKCGIQVDATHDTSGCTEPDGSLKTYYTGSSCNPIGGTCKPNPATARTQTNCPDNTCHDAVYGYNGATTGTTICARTLICAANYTSNPGYTASNEAAICGTDTSGVLDNHLACLTGSGITMNPSASPGPRRMYADGTSCAINQTCAVPNNQQTSICGDRSTATVNSQTVTVDSKGCKLADGNNAAAPLSTNTAGQYYPGNSCSKSSCYPNPKDTCPSGCRGSVDVFNGISCTNPQTCLSTLPDYPSKDTTCGTLANHYNLACNTSNILKTYYTTPTTATSCTVAACPYPWSDITSGANGGPGGQHDTKCGTQVDSTHDTAGCSNTNDSTALSSTGTQKAYYTGSTCSPTGGTCKPNPARGDCTASENSSCHGDIYGFDGSTSGTNLCKTIVKCASNASTYADRAATCGTNTSGTIDNHLACGTPSPNGLGFDGNGRRLYYQGTATSGVCNTASCDYPYYPSGNHNDVCGATWTGTIDAGTSYAATGTWDQAQACYSFLSNQCNQFCNYYDEFGNGYDCSYDCYPITISTLNSYYQGDSCFRTGTCNWPIPISCTALDAAGCHADVSGYNGQSCYFYKTCLTNIASYVPSQGQSNVCGGTDNTTACNTNGTLKTYYTGAFTNTSCNTASCNPPYYPNGNQSTACATACLNSTTPNRYYNGKQCAQIDCPFPQATTCPTNTCHGDIIGYNGSDCSNTHNLCSSSRPACCSNASSYANQTTVCGTNNSDPCDTSGNRKPYYRGTVTNGVCDTVLCPYPTNTCSAGSSDCAACTATLASCSTGTTCGKTGTCPSNYYSSPSWSSTNQVGYWKLDGNVNDEWNSDGVYNNGTIYDSPFYALLGKYNYAINLDGSTQYARVTDASSLDLSGAWTLSAWVYVNSTGTGLGHIVGKRDDVAGVANYAFRTRFGTSWDCYFRRDGWRGAWEKGTVDKGSWHHLVCTYDGVDKITIYKDGAEIGSATGVGGPPPTNNTNMAIGAWGGSNPGEYLDGRVDDLKIYSRAISANEVKALYNVTPTSSAPASDRCSDACTSTPNSFYAGNSSCTKLSCPNNYSPGSCDTTTCHAAYNYAGPNSCTANLTCAANNPSPASSCNYCAGTTTYKDANCVTQNCSTNYPSATCADCPTTCQDPVPSCYSGNACSQVGCPDLRHDVWVCNDTRCFGDEDPYRCVRCGETPSCRSGDCWLWGRSC